VDGALIYELTKERIAYINIEELNADEPPAWSQGSHPTCQYVHMSSEVRNAVTFFVTLPRTAIINVTSLLTAWKFAQSRGPHSLLPSSPQKASPTFIVAGHQGVEGFLPERVSFLLE